MSTETYPVIIARPPSAVENCRVLAWAEETRQEGCYPGGIVLCARTRGEYPAYVIWRVATKDGGGTWFVVYSGLYENDHAEAWKAFTGRCAEVHISLARD